MNFFVNQAMGIGNSGVEHAQFYRAKRFDQVDLPYRFVFMELVKNLHVAMDHWNLKDDQVINMWEFFVLGTDYAINGLASRTESKNMMLIDDSNTNRMAETITESGMRIREYFVKKTNPKNPKTLLVSTDRVEIFNATSGERKVMYSLVDDAKRGTKVFNIHLYNQDNHQHLFFPNLVQLKRYFFHQLDQLFIGQNTFIVDRGEANEVALFDNDNADWHKIDIVHADHLSNRDEPTAPLWNNYYEYVLTHLNLIDRLVVATELQRQDLLIDFPDSAQKIVTIPVGGVSDEVQSFKVKQLDGTLKLITVSRLADEKHIDLIVKAVIKLHQAGVDIVLDVFGQGGARDKLVKIIQEAKAQEYINLKGLTNHPDQEYPKYDAFVSASYSEGFGLTYIEALNAALPVVTFNARFGAQELIHDGENGFVQPFKRDDEDYNVDQLVAGIKKLLAVKDYGQLQRQVVESVSEFRDQVIANKWRDMLNEL